MSLAKLDQLLTRAVFGSLDDPFYTQTFPNYPPYNISKTENGFQIDIGVAGFKKEELEVSTQKNNLIVRSNREEKEKPVYIHQGLGQRNFDLKFKLNDYLVDSTSLENGILTITVSSDPETAPKKLDIT